MQVDYWLICVVMILIVTETVHLIAIGVKNRLSSSQEKILSNTAKSIYLVIYIVFCLFLIWNGIYPDKQDEPSPKGNNSETTREIKEGFDSLHKSMNKDS